MQIAVIGTGIMGAGFAVTAWNRSPSKLAALSTHGVRATGDVRGALADAEAAIVMLSTGAVIDEVLFDGGDAAPIAAMPRLVVMSSIPVGTARAQAECAAARGIAYLDAPVSGGETGARDGTLAIMAGGTPADFERARRHDRRARSRSPRDRGRRITRMSGQVTLQVDAWIATIVLARANKHNAITPAMAAQLAAICREAGSRDDVRVVLIRGAGERAFSAGSDLNALAEQRGVWKFRNRIEYAAAVRDIRKPVVALLHGAEHPAV